MKYVLLLFLFSADVQAGCYYINDALGVLHLQCEEDNGKGFSSGFRSGLEFGRLRNEERALELQEKQLKLDLCKSLYSDPQEIMNCFEKEN